MIGFAGKITDSPSMLIRIRLTRTLKTDGPRGRRGSSFYRADFLAHCGAAIHADHRAGPNRRLISASISS